MDLNIFWKDTVTVQVSGERQEQLLIEVIRKLTRDALVDLLVLNKEEVVRLVKSDGSSNHEIVGVK